MTRTITGPAMTFVDPSTRRRVPSPQAAARIVRLLLAALSTYFFVVALGMAIAWHMPRSIVELDSVRQALVFETMVEHGSAMLLCVILTALVRRRHRLTPRWPGILTAATVVVLSLSADRILGVFFPPPLLRNTVLEIHSERGWTHRPNSHAHFGGTMVRVDSLGLRVDEEKGPEDIAGKARFLFVGDSVTLGYGYPARAAYGSQCVDVLRGRHAGAQLAALNAGVCGYDTGQELHYLANEGLTLKPDLVILQFCLNDLTRIFDPNSIDDEDPRALMITIDPPTSKSGIRRAVQQIMLKMRFGTTIRRNAFHMQRFKIPDLVGDEVPPGFEGVWSMVVDHLDEFFRTCRTAKVPAVLVIFPVQEQMVDPSASTRVQDRLVSHCVSRDIPVLDLLPALIERFGTGPEAAHAAFFDSTHPTEPGHRVAGEATANFLEQSGLSEQALGRRAAR